VPVPESAIFRYPKATTRPVYSWAEVLGGSP